MHCAATVLLLRERDATLEVLMMRRGEGLSFMAGMWVFPGGRLDAADCSAAAQERLHARGLEHCTSCLRTMQGQPVDRDTALGLHVAACREAFEEAGVLLAVTASGEPCDPATVQRLGARRQPVTDDARDFVRMLAEEDLRLDAGRLVYWSHWITPSIEPKRFDTRFFVAALPPGQEASADLSELTEHAWIDPSALAGALERGEIRVVPPTLLTLEDLAESHARHGSLEAMLAAERGRPTPPVMPRIEAGPAGIDVVMPWDARYPSIAGEGCGDGICYPAHLVRCRSSVTVTPRRETRG
jgi:8-oxo-dGTP pyrophosphatase MutT (NUDIX family)